MLNCVVHFREVQQFRHLWLWIPILASAAMVGWIAVRQGNLSPMF